MTAIQSDHKEDGGQISILGVFRNMGPYGLPVAALFAAIILLWAIEPPVSYNSPSLNVTLYFIFSLLMPLLIIFLVSRSFVITGEPGLLMLGCGVVIWSCAGVPALVLAKGGGRPMAEHRTKAPTACRSGAKVPKVLPHANRRKAPAGKSRSTGRLGECLPLGPAGERP